MSITELRRRGHPSRLEPLVDSAACLPRPKKKPNLVPSTDDDSGRNWDLSGASDWVEIWRSEIKPRWRGGLLQISGSVSDSSNVGVTYQYATIEFRIIGSVGPAQRILRRGALGGVAGNVIHQVEDPDRWTILSVEARKIIDGATGSSISPASITASVLARFSRA